VCVYNGAMAVCWAGRVGGFVLFAQLHQLVGVYMHTAACRSKVLYYVVLCCSMFCDPSCVYNVAGSQSVGVRCVLFSIVLLVSHRCSILQSVLS
jgi:hypothetical protein